MSWSGPALDTTLWEQALAGVLPPVAVATVALVLAWKPWRRGRHEPESPGPANAWGAPLAIGLGYAAGHLATHGWPRFYPWPRLFFQLPIKQALFYLAVAAALYGLFEARRGRVSLHARALLCVAAPLYLLDFMRRHHWDGGEALLWTALLAGTLFAVWSALEVLARRRPGPSLPMALIPVGALAACALFLSGSASLAQLAGAWTAPLAVALVVSWWRPELTLAGGGVSCASLCFAGLLWAGHFTSELSTASLILLGLAPLVPWIGEVPALTRRWPGPRTVLVTCAATLPAAAAVAIELLARPADPYAGT